MLAYKHHWYGHSWYKDGDHQNINLHICLGDTEDSSLTELQNGCSQIVQMKWEIEQKGIIIRKNESPFLQPSPYNHVLTWGQTVII